MMTPAPGTKKWGKISLRSEEEGNGSPCFRRFSPHPYLRSPTGPPPDCQCFSHVHAQLPFFSLELPTHCRFFRWTCPLIPSTALALYVLPILCSLFFCDEQSTVLLYMLRQKNVMILMRGGAGLLFVYCLCQKGKRIHFCCLHVARAILLQRSLLPRVCNNIIICTSFLS